jgi:carboxyl-terminal processing protease
LDYTHRKNDGTVEKFADSLKTSFKTTSGRTVYDGGGLDPDIPVTNESIVTPVIELVRSGLVFDFATRYCNEHPGMPNFQNFHLTNADYEQFELWLKAQHFTYSTDLEKQTEGLITAAKNERYYNELQANLLTLKSQIEKNHAGYLVRFRNEIQHILEEEIAFHYGLNKGKAEVALLRDKEIEAAKKLLNDPAGYQKLLTPH